MEQAKIDRINALAKKSKTVGLTPEEKEEQALEKTAEKYKSYCVSIAERIIGNREDAEEIWNDVLSAAWNSIPPNEPEHLDLYLGKIARNAALKKLEEISLVRGMHINDVKDYYDDHFAPGGGGVDFEPLALEKLEKFQSDPEIAALPICIAKTQYSLSHDPKLLGRPRGWRMPVKDVLIYRGAGLVVPVAGEIKLMPGTSASPAYRRIDVDVETGKVKGLF